MKDKRKLYFSKSLDLSPEKIKTIADFCVFCKEALSINNGFSIYIVGERQPYDIKTTASYVIGDNEIFVYAKGRAVVDILRSIAHEMSHMRQDEMGLIDGPVQDIGGFHEDDANARAGQLIKMYAKENPKNASIYERLIR